MAKEKSNLKIFFDGSLAGKKEYEEEYRLVVNTLKAVGCGVRQMILEGSWEEKERYSEKELADIYKKVLSGIRSSDAFVCEMTYDSPSLAMEVQDAIYKYKKPALILRKKKKVGQLGAPFTGNPSKLLFISTYDKNNLTEVLRSFIRKAKRKIPSERFTVRMAEELDEYIEYLKILWKESSKNDVVTRLIKKEMATDENYKKFLESRIKHI